MHHSKEFMCKHVSFLLPPEHTCHDTMSCSSQVVVQGLEAQTNPSHLGDSKQTVMQQGCKLLRRHLWPSPEFCQAEMFNPSFAYTRLEKISCAPLSLCCQICSPLSCRIFLLWSPEGEMVQKRSINIRSSTLSLTTLILCQIILKYMF